MNRTRLSIPLACAGLLWTAYTVASHANFVPGTSHVCNLHLASGQPYVLQSRTFRWQKNEVETYTTAVAYYAPDSGEFLWFGSDYTPDQYLRYGKTYSTQGCTDTHTKILLLKDGEWANFWAINGSLWVFHSSLKFPSIDKGWQYVIEHPNESSSTEYGGKWVASIHLDKVLGPNFFHRPESLRYDARPYIFQPLTAVNKVGATWELQIQGTDERAIVVLDKDYRVVKIVKSSGTTK